MAVVKMNRLEVWAYSSDARDLSRRLVRQKCVDVMTYPLDETVKSRCDCTEALRNADDLLKRCELAIKILTPYATAKKTKILPSADTFKKDGSYDKAIELTDSVISAADSLEKNGKTILSLQNQSSAYQPWLGLDIPLGMRGTSKTDVILGSVPEAVSVASLEKKLDDLAVDLRQVSVGVGSRNLFIVSAKADTENVLRRLVQSGFQKAEFEAEEPEAPLAVAAIKRRIAELEKENRIISDFIIKSGAEISSVRILWDIAKTMKTEAELREKMAQTEECVCLIGWVPLDRAESVKNSLSKLEVAFDITEPEEAEYHDVPVKLKNNAFASCFEWVVAMYSLPAYGSYDPTAVMAFFYVVLFATMMADAGYGLLLILGGFLAPVFMKSSESLKKGLNMFGWCGVGCLVTGVLFGGYFGDLPLRIWAQIDPATVPETLAIVADPVAKPVDFLIVGLILGFIHLVTGQFIDFVIHLKESVFDAICDHVFYWIIYAGIILIILAPAPIGYIVAGAGAVLVILTAGRKEKNIFMRLPKGFLGLYGLVNFGSDIISYARILAIALSGSVLAQVFNILATMNDAPAFKFTAGILILVIGHVLNCVLSALSGFVHTSRLQYVEFFGKFYKDGGKPYVPMLPSEKFSRIN